jgi:hypothetical protein
LGLAAANQEALIRRYLSRAIEVVQPAGLAVKANFVASD